MVEIVLAQAHEANVRGNNIGMGDRRLGTPRETGRVQAGVSRTYHGYDGYTPIFAFLGVEGYAVHAQLCPGKDHSQKGSPAFLRDSLRYARTITDQPLLVRLDSGFDSWENIAVCREAGVDFLIKRNLRRESEQAWLARAKEHATTVRELRPGKRVYYGALEAQGRQTPARMVVEVVERTILPDGQVLLLPEVEIQAWWTSLPDDRETVAELYREHGRWSSSTASARWTRTWSGCPPASWPPITWCCSVLVAQGILRSMG